MGSPTLLKEILARNQKGSSHVYAKKKRSTCREKTGAGRTCEKKGALIGSRGE